MKKIGSRIPGFVLTVLSLVLTVGIKTFFSACGPKEDGSWMICHWAEQAVFASGIILACISVITLAASDRKTVLGASLAMIPAAAVTALIPGNFIGLCMMTNMHCHTVTQPSVIVVSALIAVTAGVNVFITARKKDGVQK